MALRVLNLVGKEIIQFARDRLLTAFLFLLPLLQLLLLAQATGQGITNLRVAVLDLDRSAVTRRLTAEMDNRDELVVRYFVRDEDELRTLIETGRADAGVIFPQGLAADLFDPARTAQVRMVVDGSNSLVGSVALSAVGAVLTDYGGERLSERGIVAQSPVELRVTTYYNPTYNTRVFSIPAQVGFITYQISLAVASLGLARERELGTLEQLIVAPLGRLELVLGKAIPALVIGAVNFLLMLAVTIHVFGVPLRGSFALLFGITLLFIVCEIGWGVLISALSRTQQQAILFVFILAMVDITFSGYLVPIQNLPLALQLIAQAVPMYHYLVVIRTVMVKGGTLAAVWPHALALLGLGAAILTISVRGVSRKLD